MNKKLKNVLLPIIAVAAVTVTSSLSFGMINDNQYNNKQIFELQTRMTPRQYLEYAHNLSTANDKVTALNELIRILELKFKHVIIPCLVEEYELNRELKNLELSIDEDRTSVHKIISRLDERDRKLEEDKNVYNEAIIEIIKLDPSLAKKYKLQI